MVSDLDQLFVLPIDRDDWARTPDQFAGLPREQRRGTWALIKADSPWAARRHVQQHRAAAKQHRLRGLCDNCWVDCMAIGDPGRLDARLAEVGTDVSPLPPQDVSLLVDEFGPEVHELLG